MGPLDLVRHPLIFTGITVPEFVRWYVFDQPSKILKAYFAYLRAFVEIFSFSFLVRTLFSPWRQIVEEKTERGFNLQKWAMRVSFNMVSRTIGFLFHVITLFMGIVFVTSLTVCFATFYMLWLSFPVLFWIGISFIASSAF